MLRHACHFTQFHPPAFRRPSRHSGGASGAAAPARGHPHNIARRYRRFPDHDGSLPEIAKGVELRHVEEDLDPAAKVHFGAEGSRGQGLGLFYRDDDRLYAPSRAETLLADRACPLDESRPWQRRSRLSFATGLVAPAIGGTARRPQFLKARPRSFAPVEASDESCFDRRFGGAVPISGQNCKIGLLC